MQYLYHSLLRISATNSINSQVASCIYRITSFKNYSVEVLIPTGRVHFEPKTMSQKRVENRTCRTNLYIYIFTYIYTHIYSNTHTNTPTTTTTSVAPTVGVLGFRVKGFRVLRLLGLPPLDRTDVFDSSAQLRVL